MLITYMIDKKGEKFTICGDNKLATAYYSDLIMKLQNHEPQKCIGIETLIPEFTFGEAKNIIKKSKK